MVQPGDRAPSFSLRDAVSGEAVSDPWHEGATVLAFFKTTCPVCQMAAPKVQALAEAGVRVVAVGEDPPDKLTQYADHHGQKVMTLSEPAPYDVSAAYGLEVVPSLVLVGEDGVIRDLVLSWDRARWNELADAAGGTPVSDAGDGLPPFRPG